MVEGGRSRLFLSVYFSDSVFIGEISQGLLWHCCTSPAQFLLGQRYSLPQGARIGYLLTFLSAILFPGDIPELYQCQWSHHKSKVLSIQINLWLQKFPPVPVPVLPKFELQHYIDGGRREDIYWINICSTLTRHSYSDTGELQVGSQENIPGFSAPFLTCWFCMVWTILFFPLYSVSSLLYSCFKKKPVRPLLGEALSKFNEAGLSKGKRNILSVCLGGKYLYSRSPVITEFSLLSDVSPHQLSLHRLPEVP